MYIALYLFIFYLFDEFISQHTIINIES